MAIDVHCACGADFQVRDEYAGKKGQCPTCGSIVAIPDPSANENPSPAAAVTTSPRTRKGDAPIVDDELDFEEETKPKRSRRRGVWWQGVSHGLLGLTRQSGVTLMAVGLVTVLLSRGCDSTANRAVGSVAASYELLQNEFNDRWEKKKIDVQKEISPLTEEREQVGKEIDRIREERFSDQRRDGVDYDEEIKNFTDKRDAIDKQIRDKREEIDKLTRDQAKERSDLELEEWREYRNAVRDARAEDAKSRWWRAWAFNLGTIAFALGVLTLAMTGEKQERLVGLILIGILTVSVYIGGLAWMDTVISNVQTLR